MCESGCCWGWFVGILFWCLILLPILDWFFGGRCGWCCGFRFCLCWRGCRFCDWGDRWFA